MRVRTSDFWYDLRERIVPTMSEHDAPEHDAPEHDAPEHDVPEHDAPEHDAPEHDAPEPGGPEPGGPEPGVDTYFISTNEGGQTLEAYVPAADSSESGITIATGVDL